MKQVTKMRDCAMQLSELMDQAHKFTLNSKIVAPSTVLELQVAAARMTSSRK